MGRGHKRGEVVGGEVLAGEREREGGRGVWPAGVGGGVCRLKPLILCIFIFSISKKILGSYIAI